ncbi:MAG: restriction endonuclease subunit S [Bacteroides sp.]|jgi:type I restriction enzyme S subunit|nr:restriction endonuclease subunit S [Bacteroides sp.]
MKLSEIGQIVAGGTPKTKIEEYWNGDVPWITPKDLSSHAGMYISRGERNISQVGLDNSSAKLLPKGTVLFTSRAPIGYVAIARNEVTTNQGFKSIIVDDENDNIFIYYLLKNNIDIIENHANGSTFKEISGSVMKSLEFGIPSLREQKAIAHILSTLDDKIEVNNQINKTLENMAQAIFKQWFVDFEFPNENGEPYKSSGGEMVESELGTIPKGWEVVQFRDIFRFVKGKKPKTIAECEFKDSEKYLTIDVLNRNSVLFCSKEKVIEANSEDVLMVMDGASSGAVYFGQKGVVASTLAKLELISQKVSNQFLFYAIKYFENDIKTHTTGSAIPHTDKEYTYRLMIALPNDISLQTKIDDLLCDISDTFIAREQENAVLKATRDTLLPKLMSGEIRVPLDQDGYAS